MRWSGLDAAITGAKRSAPGEPCQSIIVIVAVAMVVIVVIVRMSPGADIARGNVDVRAHVPRFLRAGADRPGVASREGRRGGGGNIDPARSNTPLDPGCHRVVKLLCPVR